MTVVWYVKGDPDKLLLATKELAEKHARNVYPERNAEQRYAMVYYKPVYEVLDEED